MDDAKPKFLEGELSGDTKRYSFDFGFEFGLCVECTSSADSGAIRPSSGVIRQIRV